MAETQLRQSSKDDEDDEEEEDEEDDDEVEEEEEEEDHTWAQKLEKRPDNTPSKGWIRSQALHLHLLFASFSCLVLSCLVLYCIKLSRSATSSSSTSYQVIPSATIIRSLLVATTVLLEIAQSKQFSSLSISISILIPFFCSVLFCSLFSPLFVSPCDFVFHQSPNHSIG